MVIVVEELWGIVEEEGVSLNGPDAVLSLGGVDGTPFVSCSFWGDEGEVLG